ncbi:RDD family protein [Aneurinibacillus uraniidurans]|uniref:RDD family protein n=1 Tax=Aneurinibacillus uraniidurans TaxID=2966586 RepID=UPI0023491F87|nr:RDD family protein [Aneurinibacillus sp. B1]WCN36250.1 RDD family protein [Aneurinibacillus sp. B1]
MNQKAGFWLRVLALTIDEIILVLLTYLLYQWLKPIILTPWSESIWFILIFYEFIDYNYYTLFWFLGGQTIGKMLVRTKIVKIDGSKFTYKDAFVRYWIWMIGVALLGIGYFWIAWQKDKQGWNDIAAKTYVIKI